MKNLNIKILALVLVGFMTVSYAKEEKKIKVMVKDVNGIVTKTVTVNGKELNEDEIAAMESSGELKSPHKKHISKIKNHNDMDIDVDVDVIDGKVIKKVIMNGKELSEKEIEQLEADGKLKTIHLDKSKKWHGKKKKKKMMIVTSDDVDHESIEIDVDVINGEVIKKISMNGKELSKEEIKKLEKSGKLKTIHLDASDNKSIHKVMLFDSEGEDGLNEHHEFKLHSKVIHTDKDHATLGFMTNIKKDGWHVISVIEGSGAEEAGLKAGDIIKVMADKNMAQEDTNKNMTIDMIKHKKGDKVKLQVLRDKKAMTMTVEARNNNSFDMVMDIDMDSNDFSWTEKLKDIDIDVDEIIEGSKNIKVIVMDGKAVGDSINFDKFDINLPDELGNMNLFITDGNSTSKLLGKNHEMSSLSKDLGSYFGTKEGVLVLHVDEENVFALEDGDVIKSIDGNAVNSPKDVIKQLLKSEEQEKIILKIVRHKRNKTLKYKK